MSFGHPGFRVDTKYTKPPTFGESVLYHEVTVNSEELATDKQRFERDGLPGKMFRLHRRRLHSRRVRLYRKRPRPECRS